MTAKSALVNRPPLAFSKLTVLGEVVEYRCPLKISDCDSAAGGAVAALSFGSWRPRAWKINDRKAEWRDETFGLEICSTRGKEPMATPSPLAAASSMK